MLDVVICLNYIFVLKNMKIMVSNGPTEKIHTVFLQFTQKYTIFLLKI